MTQVTSEADFLRDMLPDLQAEGFEVYLHPRGAAVPSFLGKLRPDAIARRADKNLVIEVIRESEKPSRRLEELSALVAQNPDWELRVIWMRPASLSPNPEVQQPAELAETLAEMHQLIAQGHFTATLLLGWAALEAIGRILLPNQFRRPQTPGRLVEKLAEEGCLTPSEADELRRLSKKRNSTIHGGLNTRVQRTEVRRFLDVLERLKSQI